MASEKPLVAIVVDHPLRDLPGLVLVARRLAQNNVDVCLVPLNLISAEVFSLSPDFVLMNNLRRTTEPLLGACIAGEVKFGMLDTEGGLYGDLEFFRSTFTDREDIRKNLACSFIWGQKIYNYLTEQKMFEPKQLYVSGAPRFDFYNPKWWGYYGKENDDGQKVVLIPTKVAVSNPQSNNVDNEVELMTEKLGLSSSMIKKWKEIGFKQIDETILMVKQLSVDFPDIRFVVRPHPHERLETYKGPLSSCENVDVIREGTIDVWIQRSSLLIHRMCTTAVEALMMGVPSVSSQWIPTAANAPDTEAVSVSASNYSSLKALIESHFSGDKIILPENEEALERIIQDWFHQVDGDSYIRVSDRIKQELGHNCKRKDKALGFRKQFFRKYNPPFSIRGVVGRFLHGFSFLHSTKWVGEVVYPHRKEWSGTTKAFGLNQVRSILNAVDSADPVSSQLVEVTALLASDRGLYPSYYKGESILITGIGVEGKS